MPCFINHHQQAFLSRQEDKGNVTNKDGQED
jgi:hypothetical protein